MRVSAYYETHKSLDAQQAAAMLQDQIDEYTEAHFGTFNCEGTDISFDTLQAASDDEDDAGSWELTLEITGPVDLDALSEATCLCLTFTAE